MSVVYGSYVLENGATVTLYAQRKSRAKKSRLIPKMFMKGEDGIKISWNEIANADGHGIILSRCNHYRVYVPKKSGKKVYFKRSPLIHAFGAGEEAAEYSESSIVKLAKSKMRLKLGKTSRIKAHLGIPAVNSLFPAGHERILRFYSSDKNVATVTKSGKVKAKSKGTCKVYVIAINGSGKAVTVTVK